LSVTREKIPTGRAGSASNPRVTEEELVARARLGEADAFGELVDRHRTAVYRTALAALGSEAEADDVAQDACIAAFRGLREFRGDAAFRTWLLTVTWRTALKRRRSWTRWQGPIAAVDGVGSLPRCDDSLQARELVRILARLVAALPRRLRDPLLLVASGEYRYEEVATLLGQPVGTTKWRVAEARRRLKDKLCRLGVLEQIDE